MTEEQEKMVLAALKEIVEARMPGQARRIAREALDKLKQA